MRFQSTNASASLFFRVRTPASTRRQELRFALAVGERLSLFPLSETMGSGKGLKWPIDGIGFSPTGRIGTSNETVAEVVELSFERPGMLVFVGRKWIAEVADALRRSSCWRGDGITK